MTSPSDPSTSISTADNPNSNGEPHRSVGSATPNDGANSPADPLLDKTQPYSFSKPCDEIRRFRILLRWMCIDHTTTWGAAVSWTVFLAAAIAIPAVSHFVLSYHRERRRYDAVVQASLTSLSALSFLCLSGFARKRGLKTYLFPRKLCMASENVRRDYTRELRKSFKLLSIFVLPCLAAEITYKLWWYKKGGHHIPFLGNEVAIEVVACILEVFSWLYRTSIFFLFCALFRLICRLQILRLKDFVAIFAEDSDVTSILKEHLHLCRRLRAISHSFRMFILSCLLLVTFSLLASLLLATDSDADVNIFNTGELAISSITIVSGILLCLRSAAKITHKAQAVTSRAAKWHVYATMDSYAPDPEVPMCQRMHSLHDDEISDDEDISYDDEDDDDTLEDCYRLFPYANTISFQRRQALVTYLENNKAGITIFGFMLDRTWLHTIFGVELTLVLWLLGKTIGIS